MLYFYIIIGLFFSILSVIVNIKIEIAKTIKEEFEIKHQSHLNLTSTTKKWLFKNFIEIALMPNALSNLNALVQFAYLFSIGYIIYSGKWIFGITYFFIILIISYLLGKIDQIRAIIILMFYRELNRKIYSSKLNYEEKNTIEKLIEIFYHKIL